MTMGERQQEAYDVLLDFEQAEIEFSPTQRATFNEAAEQIAAYQGHPETQLAIASIALADMQAEVMPVIYLDVRRNARLKSVINQ